MLMNDQNLNKKVTAYLDNLFAGVGGSQQLFDLKEELATNIKEKTADYMSRGMDKDQAFKEAIISMGDLSELVTEMRAIGQDTARKTVYSTMTRRVSTAGIIAGVLLILFGMFTVAMLYFMRLPQEAVAGSGIFIVAGGAVITYSLLTRETRQKYAMNKIRAVFYALSIGLILFSIFSGVTSLFATGEIYIAIGTVMVFFLTGIGLYLFLILTETDRRKD